MLDINKENIVDVLNLFFDSRMENVHTVIPGVFETYSGHDERKAKVKPQIKLKTVKGISVEIPAIDDVPVMFPSSAGFSLIYPIKKGDGCLLLFSETAIGNFLNNDSEVDPEDASRFSLTDCIAVPGLWSFKNVPESTSTIEITEDGDINLNGDSKSFVTYGELNTALASFKSSIDAAIAGAITGHTHAGVYPGGSTTAPGVGSAPATNIDISSSETQTIKTGG